MNKRGFKLTATLIICSLTLLLSGCWDRVEVNDLGLVLAVGLDKAENGEIEVAIQLAIPSRMGGGQGGGQIEGDPTTVEKMTGRSVFDALSKLQASISRRIFWGHNRVIFIGEELAKEGIQKHLDYFSRDPDPRIRANVFVSEGKATDILKVIPDFDKSSAEVARELANFQVGMNVTLKDLLEMLTSDVNTAALPLIEVDKAEQGKGGLRVNGTAIFKRDKMVGKIGPELTRGLLWIRDEIRLAAVLVEPEDTEGGQVVFNLLRSHTELIPKIDKNGNLKMTLKVTTEDDVVENETKLNLLNAKLVNKLQKQLENRIKERIQDTLEEVQKNLKVDVFGFGQAFYRAYPKQWANLKENWDEVFPEVEVDIDVKAYIKRTGVSTTPQGVPEKEVKN
ncbi:Ger(x)C family spore germination protein [Calidifontibacillus erzurumensis]|uniref:Ger(X)C family spore germination protein n=1 Tax=Calidifontibacillus erzurumensis TaxID=2741433 RepID=A0A8J8K8Y6_9BACI|nr:Ger(x)C family spore germination protein [Calidifontibacillus erzurumensis]NSL52491.1 Ger(x)C family spore germination protein [Calidifontibacillus erzurumensis]